MLKRVKNFTLYERYLHAENDRKRKKTSVYTHEGTKMKKILQPVFNHHLDATFRDLVHHVVHVVKLIVVLGAINLPGCQDEQVARCAGIGAYTPDTASG